MAGLEMNPWAVRQAYEDNMVVLLNGVARQIQAEARAELRGGTRSGKVYKLKGRSHQASAAGEPPKTVEGDLAKSIRVEAATRRKLVVRVGSNLFYSRMMELGTRHVAARPFLRPALAKVRAEGISELSISDVHTRGEAK